MGITYFPMHQFYMPMHQPQEALMHCEADAYTAWQSGSGATVWSPVVQDNSLSCDAYQHPVVLLEDVHEFFIIRDGATRIVNDKENPRPLI